MVDSSITYPTPDCPSCLVRFRGAAIQTCSDSKDREEELEDDSDDSCCVDAKHLNCGHIICETCNAELNYCPICQTKLSADGIDEKQTAFKSVGAILVDMIKRTSARNAANVCELKSFQLDKLQRAKEAMPIVKLTAQTDPQYFFRFPSNADEAHKTNLRSLLEAPKAKLDSAFAPPKFIATSSKLSQSVLQREHAVVKDFQQHYVRENGSKDQVQERSPGGLLSQTTEWFNDFVPPKLHIVPDTFNDRMIWSCRQNITELERLSQPIVGQIAGKYLLFGDTPQALQILRDIWSNVASVRQTIDGLMETMAVMRKNISKRDELDSAVEKVNHAIQELAEVHHAVFVLSPADDLIIDPSCTSTQAACSFTTGRSH